MAAKVERITYSDLPELSFKCELKFYAAGYTPVNPTATTPNPPNYQNRIIEEYKSVRPEITINVLPPLASGTDRTTYLQTQATSGQMADIEWHNGTEPINNLVEIGIFQNLDEAVTKA